MQWQVNGVEVIPLDDLFHHNEGMDCPCFPFDDDGVIIHNSWDNREAFETGKRKPS